MNDTQTPIDLDNFPLNEALRFADENSTTGGLVTQAALKTLAAKCRELTAVTEQLSEMTLRWELTNDSLFDKRALADRLAEELTAAREELADWRNAAEQVKAEYPDEVHCSCVAILRKQLKDTTEQRDAASAEFYRYHGLWDRATKQLETVMYQRDRLAEALRGVLRGTGCCQSDKPESHPLAKYKNALIALQSLKEH